MAKLTRITKRGSRQKNLSSGTVGINPYGPGTKIRGANIVFGYAADHSDQRYEYRVTLSISEVARAMGQIPFSQIDCSAEEGAVFLKILRQLYTVKDVANEGEKDEKPHLQWRPSQS